MPLDTAVAKLREILQGVGTRQDLELADLVTARDEVLVRYQPVFRRDSVSTLTSEQFKSFLLFKNNHHWKAIHRQGNQIVADMDALRHALGILLDEGRPLADRLRVLRPKSGEAMVKGLARSVITPILLIAYADKYGVLNQVSETGMRELGVWPDVERGADFATKYEAVNSVLNVLASELKIDLWTLDALWWRILPAGDSTGSAPLGQPEDVPETREQVFGLELHLHDFLRDNWDQTEFGRDWCLLEEDGEVVGYKYNTRAVGEIDLLAKHRKEPRWLVVELKRGRTSDEAVGQALRYRGWVKRHLAEPVDSVEAVVVAHVVDPKLLYALEGVDDVAVRTYSVRFSLDVPKDPWE